MITNKTIANRRELLGISNESDIHSSMIEYTTASLKRIIKDYLLLKTNNEMYGMNKKSIELI